MTPPEGPGPVAGVLLAGGRSRRMGGGDKCLRELAGRSILAHVIDRLQPQVGPLILNAAGDPARFAEFGLAVEPDTLGGYLGPLAGVLTGMLWATEHAQRCAYVVTVPTDAPFLPRDLVARFLAALETEGGELACAASGGRRHPVVGLWPVALADALRAAILDEEMRKIDRWTARYALCTVEFDDRPIDPFFNVNAPEDLARAEAFVA